MAFNAGSTRRHVVNGGSHVAGSPFSAQETCGALWGSRLKQLEPTPKANAACATQVKRTKRAVARQLMLGAYQAGAWPSPKSRRGVHLCYRSTQNCEQFDQANLDFRILVHIAKTLIRTRPTPYLLPNNFDNGSLWTATYASFSRHHPATNRPFHHTPNRANDMNFRTGPVRQKLDL